MKKVLLNIFAMFVLTSTLVMADILLVPLDYTTIQDGIDAASDGDTVLVYNKGTYTENIDYDGKSIMIASRYLTTSDTTYISGTIIDGDDNGSVVTLEADEDSTTKLIGFTIQNGSGNENSSYQGGGIYMDGADLTVENCIIKDNETSGSSAHGGGIYVSNFGKLIIKNSKIKNNTSGSYGGGIALFSSSTCEVENCSIDNNTASSYGGGIAGYNSNISLEIKNSTITENTASSYYGGGVYISSGGGSFIADSCDFSYNTSSSGGGAYLSCSYDIQNSNFHNNTASNFSVGGGIKAGPNSGATGLIKNCNIYNNTASQYGGGLELYSTTFEDCMIYNNTVSTQGGGGAYLSSCTTENCEFYDNSASSGGGIYMSNGTLKNCKIYDNDASTSGGGIFHSGGNIYYCETYGNTANKGGGIYMHYGGNIFSSLIRDNSAGNFGGGVYLHSNGPSIKTTTIVDNEISGVGEGNGVYFATAGYMYNSIVAYNSGDSVGVAGNAVVANIKNNLVFGNTGGAFDGVGNDKGVLNQTNANGDSCDTYYNILLNPQFTDRTNDNYELSNQSPALEAGDTTLYTLEDYDLNGEDRTFDADDDGTETVDMGCYENGDGEKAPAAPNGYAPVSNSDQITTKPTLKWWSVNYAQTYDIELAKSILFSPLTESNYNQGDTTHICGNLDENTKYYWRIRSKNANGYSDWNTYSFTTGAGGSGGGGGTVSKNVQVTMYMDGQWDGSSHNPIPVSGEIRSGSDLVSSTMVKRVSSVISSSGVATFDFGEAADGDYWLVVRAGGYLPLGTTSKVTVSTTTSTYDFTDATTKAAGGSAALKASGSDYLLRSGDLNFDRRVYSSDIPFLSDPFGKNLRPYVPEP